MTAIILFIALSIASMIMPPLTYCPFITLDMPHQISTTRRINASINEPPRAINAFVEDSFEWNELKIDGESVRFRMRRVPDRQNQRQYPVILWFHGQDECGSDNRRHLRWMELLIGTNDAPRFCPAYIIAWQLPDRRAAWDESAQPTAADRLTQLHRLIETLALREPINVCRQYLIGISHGTAGAWSYATRYRAHVAGQLLLAPSISPSLMSHELPIAPTWAFQSLADGVRAIERTQQTMDRLEDGGTRGIFTRIDRPDHNCWTAALQDFHAERWLLRQGQSTGSGSRGYFLIVLATIGLVCLKVIKRQSSQSCVNK